jgi:hypothetical protein
MAFTKLTKDMNIIAALDDEPNDVGGLSAAQLKAKFDEGGLALKTFINALIDAIAAGTAGGNIGVLDANEDATDLQSALNDVYGSIAGSIPDGSITTAKLHDEAVTNAKMASGAVKDANIDWTDSAISRIEVQTYAGNGTYGTDHKNTVTFAHEPKLVMILGYSNLAGGGEVRIKPNDSAILPWTYVKAFYTAYPNSCKFYHFDSTNVDCRYALSNDSKTIAWWNAYSADYQLNINNVYYTVVSFY